ncbi:MAG: hypothetical protein ACK4N5_10355, partial [Myxococcales bacterium]
MRVLTCGAVVLALLLPANAGAEQLRLDGVLWGSVTPGAEASGAQMSEVTLLRAHRYLKNGTGAALLATSALGVMTALNVET